MNNVHDDVDVSIVLITWNIRDLLEKCLLSIYAFTPETTFEIVLVDNNSIDGSKEMIKERFPRVKLIENSSNMGVASARNQGIFIARGKYVFILDTDTELMEDSISAMFKYMEANPAVGLIGSKLVGKNRKLQYTSRRFPTLLSIIFRRLDFFPIIRQSAVLKDHMMSDWDHNSLCEVDYVIGACQFIRKSVIMSIGMYDAKIFYGPEDLDYCLRIWRSGFKVCYFPYTSIYHYEQRITKRRPFSLITIKHLYGIFYLYIKYRGKFDRNISIV